MPDDEAETEEMTIGEFAESVSKCIEALAAVLEACPVAWQEDHRSMVADAIVRATLRYHIEPSILDAV